MTSNFSLLEYCRRLDTSTVSTRSDGSLALYVLDIFLSFLPETQLVDFDFQRFCKEIEILVHVFSLIGRFAVYFQMEYQFS